MSDALRFVDRLPVGAPYDGVVARAYDSWMPPGTQFPDDAVHASVVRGAAGSSLELGVGNGRFLIPLVEAGLPLEGVDSSADMLDRCRRHANARGMNVVLHAGDIAPLDLGRRFGALVCPAGSFTLVAEYVVHEATGDDVKAHVHLVYNRLETFDADGALVDTVLRKMRLRWWPQDQFAEALSGAGFVNIEAVGDANAWVAIATRP